MGILISHVPHHLFKNRLGKVRRWVCRRIGSTRHEQRVMQIAVGIFHLTRELHELDADHRRLLKLGTLMHDVGRFHGRNRHHIKGAKMVLQSNALDMRLAEKEAVAYLTRYHRGRIPEPARSKYISSLHDPKALRVLLAILRAADALDSRNFSTPALALRLKGNTLRARCYVTNIRKAREVFGRRKKFRLLEETLGVRVLVRFRQADAWSCEF